MSGIGDDVRRGANAFAQLLDDADQLEQAVTSVAGKVERAVGHLADRGTQQRILRAGVGAAAEAAAHEARVGTAKPPPPARAVTRRTTCPRHGDQLWNGTLACKGCGTVFQVFHRDGPRYAEETCPCCDARVTRAKEICSGCYPGIVASGGRAAPWRAPG